MTPSLPQLIHLLKHMHSVMNILMFNGSRLSPRISISLRIITKMVKASSPWSIAKSQPKYCWRRPKIGRLPSRIRIRIRLVSIIKKFHGFSRTGDPSLIFPAFQEAASGTLAWRVHWRSRNAYRVHGFWLRLHVPSMSAFSYRLTMGSMQFYDALYT